MRGKEFKRGAKPLLDTPMNILSAKGLKGAEPV
jgi:hypothetical protein